MSEEAEEADDLRGLADTSGGVVGGLADLGLVLPDGGLLGWLPARYT